MPQPGLRLAGAGSVPRDGQRCALRRSCAPQRSSDEPDAGMEPGTGQTHFFPWFSDHEQSSSAQTVAIRGGRLNRSALPDSEHVFREFFSFVSNRARSWDSRE